MFYIGYLRIVYMHVKYIFELSLVYWYVEWGYEYQFGFVYIWHTWSCTVKMEKKWILLYTV